MADARKPDAETQATFTAPHPGSQDMPRWDVGPLSDAPRFTWKNWIGLLGPGLLMGGAAIGAGEWIAGPAVTARYGGSLMWLATLSILAQMVYNIEISRYTLYCGEPIFTGKFRTMPGPRFWLMTYLVLDFGAVFPYLAANAATPLAAVMLGEIPDPTRAWDFVIWGHEFNWKQEDLLRLLSYFVFLISFIPLVFGGKIYNSLKAVMGFKIVLVFSFLLVLSIFHTSPAIWKEILTGFVRFGSVPITRGEDLNENGVLDPGEDWDSDGHLDVVEPLLPMTVDADGDGKPDTWADINGDGKPDKFTDIDGDGIRDGDNIDNIFMAIYEGRDIPTVELSMIAMLCAFAAIAGQGGLSNTPISNYTRDQGWGMGHHVGAIPGMIGGHELTLSHVGMVFQVTPESLPRWKRWYRHVCRDQMVVWMPACFLGLALPSMLSVAFLRRGVEASDWAAAGMTADGVRQHIAESSWGLSAGELCWYLTLFCGFLVLAPTMASTIDGVVRRWVDVFWTSSAFLRRCGPEKIGLVYFMVLSVYCVFGLFMLYMGKPKSLFTTATIIYNFALGFSCLHVIYLNTTLLPKELRPNWFIRLALFFGGIYFMSLTIITALKEFGFIGIP